ncbi:MAG: lipopolysaccharide biosynthesis protein, partial [Mycobacteriales bacterium]
AEIRRFLIGTNVLGAIRAISTKLDTILVGAIATPAAVAIYRIALQFAKVPLLVADALFSVVYPDFARDIGAGRQAQAEAHARRLTVLLAPAGLVVGAAIALEAPALVDLVVGASFRSAATPLRITLIGIVPSVVVFWAPALLLALGRATDLVRVVGLAVAGQFTAIVALVPSFGPSGAAAGFAIAYLLALLLQVRFLWQAGVFTPSPDVSIRPE